MYRNCTWNYVLAFRIYNLEFQKQKPIFTTIKIIKFIFKEIVWLKLNYKTSPFYFYPKMHNLKTKN